MWKNNVEPNRPQMTTWRMPIEYWIPKLDIKLTLSALFSVKLGGT
jgi:hypothetical protein